MFNLQSCKAFRSNFNELNQICFQLLLKLALSSSFETLVNTSQPTIILKTLKAIFIPANFFWRSDRDPFLKL